MLRGEQSEVLGKSGSDREIPSGYHSKIALPGQLIDWSEHAIEFNYLLRVGAIALSTSAHSGRNLVQL